MKRSTGSPSPSTLSPPASLSLCKIILHQFLLKQVSSFSSQATSKTTFCVEPWLAEVKSYQSPHPSRSYLASLALDQKEADGYLQIKWSRPQERFPSQPTRRRGQNKLKLPTPSLPAFKDIDGTGQSSKWNYIPSKKEAQCHLRLYSSFSGFLWRSNSSITRKTRVN